VVGRTRHCAGIRQRTRERNHEKLVCHGINDCPHDALQVIPSCYPSVNEICESGIEEQACCEVREVVQDEVGYYWCGQETREREDVGDCVYVFVFFRFRSRCAEGTMEGQLGKDRNVRTRRSGKSRRESSTEGHGLWSGGEGLNSQSCQRPSALC